MNKRPRVALLVELSSSYGGGLLRGIHAYVREHKPWLIYLLEAEHGTGSPVQFNDKWRGDGIVAHIESQALYNSIKNTSVPLVDLGALGQFPRAPTVEPDERMVAKLAIDHFIERGFKHFGFYGDDRFLWAERRRESFAELLALQDYPCHVYVGSSLDRHGQVNWEQENERLSSWICRIPKPVGVMACYDYHAWRLLEICRSNHVSVPDDVAVIGVDNDELICDLATPPLSSVILDTHRIGYEAAKMLDHWMSGKPPAKSLKIPPLGVVTRQSTDVLAITDVEVSQAVQYIRNHACEGIKVEDILQSVPLSRSVLEYRFKKLLGRTPHEEILRVQFERVTKLLQESELPIAIIADRAGFRHAEYMTVAFKNRFNTTPSEYRETYKK